jgi:V/A-type H+-transporting ATPase subunit B
MNLGIGRGRTREDHRGLADQLYAFYARGQDVRRMEAIVGEGSLSDEERQCLLFADRFEAEFVHQGRNRRSIDETLAAGWRLLSAFPVEALTRIKKEFVERYRKEGADGARIANADGPSQG